jgi:signal transduction histidine kinase
MQDLRARGLLAPEEPPDCHDFGLVDGVEERQPGGERWVAIRVGDTGAGLPPELGERIFEPFVSTKETGTGLGLSICQRIVAAHGGELRAMNRAEGGAEFAIWLPQPALAWAAVEGPRPAQLGAV